MFLDKFKKFLVANFRLFSLIIPLIILGCGYLYFLRPKYNYLKKTGGLTLNILKSSLQSKKEYLKNLEELKLFPLLNLAIKLQNTLREYKNCFKFTLKKESDSFNFLYKSFSINYIS